MPLEFSNYFWGEKHNGFDVLYQNMKYESVASKDMSDFFKERSNIEENNVKLFNKLAKQVGSYSTNGTFAPLWQILKTSTESISCIHTQMVQKFMDLVKDTTKYSEDLHRKHKTVKENESATIEVVQSMQSITLLVLKARDYFLLKGYDYEKLKKDNAPSKDVEKAHNKFEKSREDYRTMLDKYYFLKDDFERKMTVSCQNFQSIEESHLIRMKEFLQTYTRIVRSNCELISKTYDDFLKQFNEFTNEKLLEQFCLSKCTGREMPVINSCATMVEMKRDRENLIHILRQEEEKCTKSQKNLNQRKCISPHAVITQEMSETFPNQRYLNYADLNELKAASSSNTNATKSSSFGTKTSRRTISLLNLFMSNYQGNKGSKNECPSSAPSSPVNSSSILSSKKTSKLDIDNNPVRGSKWFLRSRKTKGKKLKKNNSNCDKSDLDESEISRNNSSLKESIEIDDDGYSVKPEQLSDNKDNKNGFYSDSDTDSDADKEKKIHVEIKPINTAPIFASVDELRATVGALSIIPSYRNENNVSPDLTIKRSQSVSQQLTNNKVNDLIAFQDTNKLNGFAGGDNELNLQNISTANIVAYMSIPRPPSRKVEISVMPESVISPLTIERTDSINSLEFKHSCVAVHSSRGPSPLTISFNDSIPLAIAFHEIIHAFFHKANELKCQVKMCGDLMVSFPAVIVNTLTSNPTPAKLAFNIKNTQNVCNLTPNTHLVTMNKSNSTNDFMQLEFNMHNLNELLKKKYEENPSASYFNADILKYHVVPKSGAMSCPLQLVAYWKCEQNHTDLKIDYKYNSHAMSVPIPLTAVTISVEIEGNVTSSQSKPTLEWKNEENKACWYFDEISSKSENNGIGTIRARFEIENGPSYPQHIFTQFTCEGAHLSNLEFQLVGYGYRISLTKRKFISGKYVCVGDLVKQPEQ